MASKNKPKNILVIGDLHEPFSLDGYLAFCKQVQKQYKTDHTIFIGDVIDNHYASYHEADPDGYGAGEELKRATDRLAKWHKAFPNADVTIGNHDRMASRKVFSAGLSQSWLRNINEVLQVPTWNFQTSFIYNNVQYTHGDKCVTAKTAALRMGINRVQGHRHNESYVWHNQNTWGIQVGTGVDDRAYAMAYAQEGTNLLSCGVVLENGTMPLVIPYKV